MIEILLKNGERLFLRFNEKIPYEALEKAGLLGPPFTPQLTPEEEKESLKLGKEQRRRFRRLCKKMGL